MAGVKVLEGCKWDVESSGSSWVMWMQGVCLVREGVVGGRGDGGDFLVSSFLTSLFSIPTSSSGRFGPVSFPSSEKTSPSFHTLGVSWSEAGPGAVGLVPTEGTGSTYSSVSLGVIG